MSELKDVIERLVGFSRKEFFGFVVIDSSLERFPHQLFDFSEELALLHCLGSLFAFASPFGSGCFLSRFISPFDRSGLNGAH